MKRRYSNFHRARKYYRQLMRINREPRHLLLMNRASPCDLYEKYMTKAESDDGIVVRYAGAFPHQVLTVDTKVNLRSRLAENYRTDLAAILESGRFNFIGHKESVVVFS